MIMSKMSEMSLEIQERLANGEEPRSIANSLNIPVNWVHAVEDDYLYITADDYADVDAIAYGVK